MQTETKTLYVITGPTAVGKTELALQRAEELGAEILSCDSLLFYKEMNIGTAKPTDEELGRVPHHGIDLVPVSEQYSIAAYLDYALRVVEDIHARGKEVMITGGSGFYLKAFFEPVVDDVHVPKSVEMQVKEIWHDGGLERTLEELRRLSPDGLGDLDLMNPRRVSKALGRCLASGKSVLELKESFENLRCPFEHYEKHLTLLSREDADLKARIELRVDLMLEAGLVDEVRELLEREMMDNPSARSAIGYREVIQWIREGEEGGMEDLRALIIRNTNRLVAKQRKWFRNQVAADEILEM